MLKSWANASVNQEKSKIHMTNKTIEYTVKKASKLSTTACRSDPTIIRPV